MTGRELLREIDRLLALPPTVDDWRDLHDMIEAYERRRLARAIVASPRRAELLEAIGAIIDAADD